MQDNDLLRYSRQIMLPQVDIEGQEQLLTTTMLIIGLGGLGAISSQYLAASGVGHLILADFDKVELSNLQRQIIHYTNDIGKLKIISAKEKLAQINPNIKITTIENLDNCLDKWVNIANIVLDGTDNFQSRFAINKSCVANKTPLVSASVIRFEGQIAVFSGYDKNKPCYNCLYPQNSYTDETCVNSGVFSPIVGIIGSIQATQALKVALNIGELLDDKLLLVDSINMNFKTIKLKKDYQCQTCKYTVS